MAIRRGEQGIRLSFFNARTALKFFYLWNHMVRYLDRAELTPDNNAAGNAIHPFAVGRKNWLFAGSPSGAEASALFYTLIESAKANDVNVQ